MIVINLDNIYHKFPKVIDVSFPYRLQESSPLYLNQSGYQPSNIPRIESSNCIRLKISINYL